MAFKIMPFDGQQYKGQYADHHDIRMYFGLPEYGKLPMDFTGNVQVELTDGRTTRIVCGLGKPSTTGDWRGKSSRHRVRAQCPDCKDWVPAGRTTQHKCKEY